MISILIKESINSFDKSFENPFFLLKLFAKSILFKLLLLTI